MQQRRSPVNILLLLKMGVQFLGITSDGTAQFYDTHTLHSLFIPLSNLSSQYLLNQIEQERDRLNICYR